MRIRTIKPEFFLHEDLYELESKEQLPIRVSFAGLWCIADREGRFKWEPRKIGVQILPYDCIDFSRVLDALLTRGFVGKYRVESVDYGWIPSFTRHQVINNRERPSELPEPNDTNACNACPTREGRVPHAGKAEGKGMEGKGTGKGMDSHLPLKGRKPKPEPSPDGQEFAVWFRSLLSEALSLPATWKVDFARSYDEMVRIDKRTDDEISEVCQFGMTDNFWSKHFKQPAYLRKISKTVGIQHFDQILDASRAKPEAEQRPTVNLATCKL